MVSVPKSPLGEVLPRFAEPRVAEALTDTRVVLINGARQCGKTTLAKIMAHHSGAEYRSFDSATWRHAAATDPTEFVSGGSRLVIDEVQRVPGLLLAIKEAVDDDPAPGRFLLTGSSRLLGLKAVPDALPGRMETVELWPLSQGEIDRGRAGRFVDAVFDAGPAFEHTSEETRSGYVSRLSRGGFPGAIARAERRRQRFLEEYVSDLVNRDVRQVAQVENSHDMRRLIQLLASRSGQLIVPQNLASGLAVTAPTVRRYLEILEELFLIKRIPAFSGNLTRRVVGTPKVAFVDSGLAAVLAGFDSARLMRPGAPLGGLLEAFAAMELSRLFTWSEERVELFHYRTKDQIEVDLVLENRRGQVVAIDVKASSTVRGDDFRGIRHLAGRLGSDFLAGFVLYTGTRTVPFGPKNRAVPLAALWEA